VSLQRTRHRTPTKFRQAQTADKHFIQRMKMPSCITSPIFWILSDLTCPVSSVISVREMTSPDWSVSHTGESQFVKLSAAHMCRLAHFDLRSLFVRTCSGSVSSRLNSGREQAYVNTF
jgi:hypothetical protein